LTRIKRATKTGQPLPKTTGTVEGFTGSPVSADQVGLSGARRVIAVDPNKPSGAIGTKQDVISVMRATPAVAASLTTAMAGTNNDLKYTAKPAGTAGNARRVAHVVAGANTPLSVGVSGNDITVNVATDGSSLATSTAALVRAAVLASVPAMALLDKVELATGNDGTGIVAAFALTNLAGGLQAVTVPFTSPNQVAGPSPSKVDGSIGRRQSTLPPQVKHVVNRSANRSIKKT